MAVPMESSAKGLLFGAFPRRIASFRVAGVALCDIPTCFSHDMSKVVLCGRRKTFRSLSADALHFSWQAQHFGRVLLRVFRESHCQRCAKW